MRNLAYCCSEEDLTSLFEKYGNRQCVDLNKCQCYCYFLLHNVKQCEDDIMERLCKFLPPLTRCFMYHLISSCLPVFLFDC